MKIIKLFHCCVVFFTVLFITNCATYNPTNVYEGIEILSFNQTRGYEFRNPTSSKLLIILEGSSWNSSLGRQKNNRWYDVGMASQLIPLLRDRYTIFIPERFDREPGENYFNNFNDRARYTFDNVLISYKESITTYLTQNEFDSIVIFSASEGAFAMPILYSYINDTIANTNITLLISLAGGGLSPREGNYIFANAKNTPRAYRSLYEILVEEYKTKPYPDSLEIGYFGAPYRFWSSLIDVRPFDYYKDINIPVLFLHGERDIRVTVESTRYVEKNLPHKPFEYIYYPRMGHSPSNRREVIRLHKDIANWIIKNDS